MQQQQCAGTWQDSTIHTYTDESQNRENNGHIAYYNELEYYPRRRDRRRCKGEQLNGIRRRPPLFAALSWMIIFDLLTIYFPLMPKSPQGAAIGWYDISKTLLWDKILPYAVQNRTELETCCLIDKETNQGMRDHVLPPWPTETEIQADTYTGMKFAVSERFIYAGYGKVYDRFGYRCTLPPRGCMWRQQHHQIVKIGTKHILAMSFTYHRVAKIQIWDLENAEQGPVAEWSVPDQAGAKCMKFSEDGSLLAVGSSYSVGQDSGVVFLYQTSDWTCVSRLQGPSGSM